MAMDFGFTNSDEQYQLAVDFRNAAVADGWDIKPTYDEHESVESHATLAKEGFICHVKARVKKPGSTWKYEAEVSIWGPDRLAIIPPKIYNWDEIKANVNQCMVCKTKELVTYQVGFAGRVCEFCLPDARKKYEFPGWTR